MPVGDVSACWMAMGEVIGCGGNASTSRKAQDDHLEPCDCGWTPELEALSREAKDAGARQSGSSHRFSPDSLVKEAGFEPLVPPSEATIFAAILL
jgi:hypothetical protein